MASPFEDFQDLHGSTPDKITAAADKPGVSATMLAQLGDDLLKDAKASDTATEGDLKTIAAVPKVAAGHAHTLAGAGQLAAGCLRKFGSQAATFDTKVADLNNQVLHAPDPYVHDPDYRTGKVKVDFAKIRKEKESELRPEYNRLVTKLDGDAEEVAGLLKGGPKNLANIKTLIREGFIPLTAASAFPGLTITPGDKYAYYRAQIGLGLMPDFKDMTEQQRQAFNTANPDLLKYLMSLQVSKQDHPDQLTTDVIALALPHVTGPDGKTDAQTVLDAVDSKKEPADFLSAFGHVGDVNAALALLTPWATKNGVNLAKNASVSNVHAYLKNFVDSTYPHRGDIEKYINAGEHKWKTGTVTTTTPYNPYGGGGGIPQTTDVYDSIGGFTDSWKDTIHTAWADAILNDSNEDLGGSWDDLPSDLRHDADQLPPTDTVVSGGFPVTGMDSNDDFKNLARLLAHGDVAAGDDLSKHLASTAMTSNSMWDEYKRDSAGGDKFPNWDDDLTGQVMNLVSRNHEATTDLLTGHDVPPNYYGNIDINTGKFADGEDVLAGYYGSDFNAELFGHDWSSDSEQNVNHMIDWIHDSHAAGGHEQELADRAFTGLANSLTNTDNDTFKNLMGTDGESAAHNNRTLALSLTDALSDHLDQLAAADGTTVDNTLDLSKPDAVRLMTLLASDHDTGDHQSAANRLSTYVAAYEHDRVASWAHDPNVGPRELAGSNGRLSGMLDSALMNEASERGLNANDAEAERIRNLKIASGIVSTLAGKIPVVGDVAGPATGIGNTLLANLVTADHLPAPAANVDPDWQPDGSHVVTPNTRYLIDALVEQHKIDPKTLPTALQGNVDGESSDAVTDAADQVLTKYFTEHPVKDAHGNVIADSSFLDNYETTIHSAYKDTNDWYGLSHKDDNQIKEFLTSKTWGRP